MPSALSVTVWVAAGVPLPVPLVKNSYITVPLGVKAAGLAVTVAVSNSDSPRTPLGGWLVAASRIAVAVPVLPWLMVSGSTGLVLPV